MLQPPNRPNSPMDRGSSSPQPSPGRANNDEPINIIDEIVKTIHGLPEGLQAYPIRILVEQAQKFGPYLKQQRLETNQIRKILDAINQMKATLAKENDFSKIETEVILLKPKLAYAAARQDAVKPLSKVMTAAIDKVNSAKDFERLVQLLESILAYHKEAENRR